MTRVFLIRHGATASNREHPYRLQGRASDLPLDEIGLDQVRRAAEALAGFPLSAVYSSPLLRARMTGEAVARPHGLTVSILDVLMEAEIGRWEGLTWDQARAQDPVLHEQFHANPGTVPYPGGESFLDVQRRVSPAIAGLARTHEGQAIAVIGHNVVNRAYLAGLLGVPIDKARALRQANGGINLIQYGETVTVEMMNGCLHL
jgi:broad specificity phosphatase PhoE